MCGCGPSWIPGCTRLVSEGGPGLQGEQERVLLQGVVAAPLARDLVVEPLADGLGETGRPGRVDAVRPARRRHHRCTVRPECRRVYRLVPLLTGLHRFHALKV